MKYCLSLVILFSLILFSCQTPNPPLSQTQRGRVQIKDGTLVTDKGTLLRGAHTDTHNESYTLSTWVTSEYISGLKNYGINCIRLFAESAWDETPGNRAAFVDSVVSWTRNNSMYLIITIGGWVIDPTTPEESNTHNRIKGFWEFYAPRYKDETHVIYEICNEPGPTWYSDNSIQMDSSALEMNRQAYEIIRALAPETHILLMSPWNIYYDNFINDIEKLGDGIDWNNASIAGHAYWKPAQDTITPIRNLKNARYALTITEFASLENEYANLALTRVFEQEHVSYFHFLSAKQIIDNPAVFKARVESSEVRWTPDFGTWPESITEINYERPYKYRPAMFYDEGSGWSNDITRMEIEYITNNSYIAYYNIDFEEGPETFTAYCASPVGAGTIRLHLDSLNGPIVGTCPVGNTGDWEVYLPFLCAITQPFGGVHNLYLVFQEGFNLKCWFFIKSGLLTSQTPYHGAASVLPGKIEAEEYDLGGLNVAYFDNTLRNNGNTFRNDDVDIDKIGDEGYCIGWTEQGEWVEYTVKCEQDTAMDIQLRVACEVPGDKIELKFNNQALATVNLPDTGGYWTYQTVTVKNIMLTKGENQILRLEILGNCFNLDWLNFIACGI